MKTPYDWRRAWEEKSKRVVSDFEFDRGTSPRQQELENLSDTELIDFIEPKKFEIVLDAGCGSGVNVHRLHSRVKGIVAFDYSSGSVERCRKRIRAHQIENAEVFVASVSAIPLPDSCVDKVLCMSVLQYLNEQEVRRAFKEFVRVLTPGGIIILHVKNLSSLYWSTLWVAKKLKLLLGGSTRLEHLRSFRWYVNGLESVNCLVLDYNSFNMLYLDGMPRKVLTLFQTFELRHSRDLLFHLPFIRRHGAELKIKARIPARCPEETRADEPSL